MPSKRLMARTIGACVALSNPMRVLRSVEELMKSLKGLMRINGMRFSGG